MKSPEKKMKTKKTALLSTVLLSLLVAQSSFASTQLLLKSGDLQSRPDAATHGKGSTIRNIREQTISEIVNECAQFQGTIDRRSVQCVGNPRDGWDYFWACAGQCVLP